MPRAASTSDNSKFAGTRVLGLLFAGVFLGALDIAIVGPALPAIQADLSLDSRAAASIFSVYIFFGLLSAPLLASYSDRVGRRRIYALCLVLFGVGSLLVASSGSIVVLLAGRAVQAIGAGGMLPVASAVIADTFPLERRGRALGIIGAVFGLAFVLGPVIGAVMLQWSWRWLFLVNLPFVVLLLAASAAWLPDNRGPRSGPPDLAGAALLAAGLALAAFGASRLGLATAPLLAFAGAAVCLGAFWRAERRAAAPLVDPRLLASGQMQIIGTLGIATGLVEAAMVFLPTLAVAALDVVPSRASFMLLPLVAALIAGSILAGRLLDRIGAKPVIQLGMAMIIAGLAMFGALPLTTVSFYTAGIVVGLGLASLLGAPLRFAALEEGGEANRGASQGLLTVSLGIGRLVGASLTGGMAAGAAAALVGYRESMLVIAGAACVALALSAGLRRR